MSQLYSAGRQLQLQYAGVPSTVSVEQQDREVTKGRS